jgi:TIR domain-containing protein
MALAHAARSMNAAHEELHANRRAGASEIVFVSYDHRNQNLARRVERLLARNGYDAWWDDRIGPGEKFAVKIGAAIEAAVASIVIWSPQSVQSAWVKWEAEQGARYSKLVPVAVPELDLRDIMPPFNILSTLRFGDDVKLLKAISVLRERRCGVAGCEPFAVKHR